MLLAASLTLRSRQYTRIREMEVCQSVNGAVPKVPRVPSADRIKL